MYYNEAEKLETLVKNTGDVKNVLSIAKKESVRCYTDKEGHLCTLLKDGSILDFNPEDQTFFSWDQ